MVFMRSVLTSVDVRLHNLRWSSYFEHVCIQQWFMILIQLLPSESYSNSMYSPLSPRHLCMNFIQLLHNSVTTQALRSLRNVAGLMQDYLTYLVWQDRYDEFVHMLCKWWNLKLLKCSGHAHDPVGLDETKAGQSAVLCLACLQSGKNFHVDFLKAPLKQWYVTLLI